MKVAVPPPAPEYLARRKKKDLVELTDAEWDRVLSDDDSAEALLDDPARRSAAVRSLTSRRAERVGVLLASDAERRARLLAFVEAHAGRLLQDAPEASLRATYEAARDAGWKSPNTSVAAVGRRGRRGRAMPEAAERALRAIFAQLDLPARDPHLARTHVRRALKVASRGGGRAGHGGWAPPPASAGGGTLPQGTPPSPGEAAPHAAPLPDPLEETRALETLIAAEASCPGLLLSQAPGLADSLAPPPTGDALLTAAQSARAALVALVLAHATREVPGAPGDEAGTEREAALISDVGVLARGLARSFSIGSAAGPNWAPSSPGGTTAVPTPSPASPGGLTRQRSDSSEPAGEGRETGLDGADDPPASAPKRSTVTFRPSDAAAESAAGISEGTVGIGIEDHGNVEERLATHPAAGSATPAPDLVTPAAPSREGTPQPARSPEPQPAPPSPPPGARPGLESSLSPEAPSELQSGEGPGSSEDTVIESPSAETEAVVIELGVEFGGEGEGEATSGDPSAPTRARPVELWRLSPPAPSRFALPPHALRPAGERRYPPAFLPPGSAGQALFVETARRLLLTLPAAVAPYRDLLAASLPPVLALAALRKREFADALWREVLRWAARTDVRVGRAGVPFPAALALADSAPLRWIFHDGSRRAGGPGGTTVGGVAGAHPSLGEPFPTLDGGDPLLAAAAASAAADDLAWRDLVRVPALLRRVVGAALASPRRPLDDRVVAARWLVATHAREAGETGSGGADGAAAASPPGSPRTPRARDDADAGRLGGECGVQTAAALFSAPGRARAVPSPLQLTAPALLPCPSDPPELMAARLQAALAAVRAGLLPLGAVLNGLASWGGLVDERGPRGKGPDPSSHRAARFAIDTLRRHVERRELGALSDAQAPAAGEEHDRQLVTAFACHLLATRPRLADRLGRELEAAAGADLLALAAAGLLAAFAASEEEAAARASRIGSRSRGPPAAVSGASPRPGQAASTSPGALAPEPVGPLDRAQSAADRPGWRAWAAEPLSVIKQAAGALGQRLNAPPRPSAAPPTPRSIRRSGSEAALLSARLLPSGALASRPRKSDRAATRTGPVAADQAAAGPAAADCVSVPSDPAASIGPLSPPAGAPADPFASAAEAPGSPAAPSSRTASTAPEASGGSTIARLLGGGLSGSFSLGKFEGLFAAGVTPSDDGERGDDEAGSARRPDLVSDPSSPFAVDLEAAAALLLSASEAAEDRLVRSVGAPIPVPTDDAPGASWLSSPETWASLARSLVARSADPLMLSFLTARSSSKAAPLRLLHARATRDKRGWSPGSARVAIALCQQALLDGATIEHADLPADLAEPDGVSAALGPASPPPPHPDLAPVSAVLEALSVGAPSRPVRERAAELAERLELCRGPPVSPEEIAAWYLSAELAEHDPLLADG